MNRLKDFISKTYVYFILIITYIPLMFALVFSFNTTSKRGALSFQWNQFTDKAWTTFFAETRGIALVNSLIIASATAIITVLISLITVFALWKQKNKIYENATKSTYSITMINPDVITAIGLVLVYSLIFSTLAITNEGMIRAIVGHCVIALPYAISIMHPASQKFNRNLFEASQDLGYSKFQTWFKVYLVHMAWPCVFAAIVAIFFSMDDFIITRLVSNTSTLGTKLYESSFRAWGLVVGSVLMLLSLSGTFIYVIVKWKKEKANAKIS
ncbi:ABC transporter permease [Mycoplasma phocoenae]|uniref:ABC transporter permease subunit n=1 Tax=Mycoplasma phocoenae TaxID=754517 RepID=A0A858U400_9MOLU|nr:ABC transporter permease subunit [Mycoplasma phocoenae]QJG66741.1 ABC transporter permease subunit [Mycoplasma phocoenae]